MGFERGLGLCSHQASQRVTLRNMASVGNPHAGQERLSLSLSAEIVQFIRETAEAEGTTLSAVVEKAAREARRQQALRRVLDDHYAGVEDHEQDEARVREELGL